MAKSQGIIAIGQQHAGEFEEELYLHSSKYTYLGESLPFSKFAISAMNKMMTKLVSKQKKKEDEALAQLGCSLEELNRFFSSQSGSNYWSENIQEEVNNTLDTIIYNAVNNLEIDINTTRNKKREADLNNAIQQQIDIITKENEKKFNAVYNLLINVGIDKQFIDLFNEYALRRHGKGKSKTMERFISNNVIKDIQNTLSNEYGDMVQEMRESIAEAYFNDGNKNIRKKRTLSTTNTVDTSFLTKAFNKKNNFVDEKVNFNLGGGNLSTFYDNVKKMNESNVAGFGQIISLIDNKFNSNNFKYHLVNQAVIFSQQQNLSQGQSQAGDLLLSFIKKCIPLLINIKFSEKVSEVNFFFYKRKLIRGSDILQQIFFNNSYGQEVQIEYNTASKVNMKTLLKDKKQFDVEVKDYYNAQEREVGSMAGRQVYENIQIPNLRYSIALKNLM